MTKEIYTALKKRISIVPDEIAKDYCEHYGFCNVYHMNTEGMNVGIDENDEGYFDGFIHGMKTKNIWNVAQRFYSFCRYYPNIDERILNI